MRKLLVYFILTVFYSCTQEDISIPEDVISKNEMAAVLTDIHIAQAALNNRSRVDTLPFSVNEYVLLALKKNNLEREQFLKSLKFYSAHPEILKEVYDSVITGLSRMQD